MRSCGSLGLPGTWRPFVHSPCPHNEIAALLTRSLGPVPARVFEPLDPSVLREFRILQRLTARYAGDTWDYLRTACSYQGALRRRYLEAERSLRVDGPVVAADWKLRVFLKAEKFNAVAKKVKPRLIFPRSPRYNLALATRLKPLEHWLWGRLCAKVVACPGVGRVVAKGLSPAERARLIRRKMSNLDDCRVFEADAKSFEAHVGPGWLSEEHRVYGRAFPGDRELRRLLSAQLTLKGKLSCGARFERPGGRASGDFNTGMGNSLHMLVVVLAVLRRYKVPFDVLVDGDNALVFLRARDIGAVVPTFAQHALDLTGHELSLESAVGLLEEVRFGQCAPLDLGGGKLTMVREFVKVQSHALASHRWLRDPSFAREWVRGVAACELSLAIGVPVLQAWALRLVDLYGGPEGVRMHPHADLIYQGAWAAKAAEAEPVSPEARLSFERAFGVTPDAQLEMEARMGKLEAVDFHGGWLRVEMPSFDLWPAPPGFTEACLDGRSGDAGPWIRAL